MSATISLTIKFNLDTGKFLFTDISNYAAQGSPDTGVKGVLRITGPSGLVYANAAFATPVSATADITTAGSFVNGAINIPIDASGVVQKGVYTFEYSVYVTGGTDIGTTFTITPIYFDFCFDKPVVSITQYVDCINAIFTSTDSTNYTVDGIIPSVVRTHSVKEVANTSRTNISNTNASNTVIYPNLYNGDYKTTISSVATYTLSAYSIVATVVGSLTYTVSCIEQCDLYCGLKTVEASYQSNLAIGDIKAAENDKSKIALLSSYIMLYTLAVGCGKTNEATTYLAKINAIGNFTDKCCTGTGQIIPANSSSVGLETTESGIIASTVQSQVGSTPLYAKYSRIDTVANANDGCVMVAAVLGDVRYVDNFATSNSMKLYPAAGEQLRPVAGLLAVNASVTIAAGVSSRLVCYETGVWTYIVD